MSAVAADRRAQPAIVRFGIIGALAAELRPLRRRHGRLLDAHDFVVTDCDRDVPLLDNACVVLEHRCRPLANTFDVDFECRTDARRCASGIRLGRGAKSDCAHVSSTLLTKA